MESTTAEMVAFSRVWARGRLSMLESSNVTHFQWPASTQVGDSGEESSLTCSQMIVSPQRTFLIPPSLSVGKGTAVYSKPNLSELQVYLNSTDIWGRLWRAQVWLPSWVCLEGQQWRDAALLVGSMGPCQWPGQVCLSLFTSLMQRGFSLAAGVRTYLVRSAT